jgi:hypothetical protein
MGLFSWLRLPKRVAEKGVSRRGFVASLVTAPVGSIVQGASAREAQFTLSRFYVAGFQYHDGPAVVARLEAGQEFALAAEQSNIHDEFAVAIHWGPAHLGYIPRLENRNVSRLLQQGAKLRCRAVTVAPEEVPWQMLEVEVWLVTPAITVPA